MERMLGVCGRVAIALLMPMALSGGLAATALAGPNAGGTLIVHYPGLSYTTDTTDYCGIAPLSSCAGSVSRIDGSGPGAIKVWKVYAAFADGSSPRLKGVSFGLTYATNVALPAHGYGLCADTEIPDHAWPGSGTGNALVWDVPQTATLVECYWFAGYTSGGPGTFALGPNPSLGGAFTDDSLPPNVDPIYAYGILGFNTAGNNPCPSFVGACCFPDGSCIVYTAGDCAVHGGSYRGDNTVCAPNPCPQPPGACCFNDGTCRVLSSGDCSLQGGIWLGSNVPCSPDPCPLGGACCISGVCTITIQRVCQGQWMGANTTCDPNPCAPGGACCITGDCKITTEAGCQGQWMGANTTCDPNPCPQPNGACCELHDGTCAVTNRAGCQGLWLGSYATCDPNPCPIEYSLGACCIDGICTVTLQLGCQGRWLGPGTRCTPNPCLLGLGACCSCGACAMTTQAGCSGSWLGPNWTCSPNPCQEMQSKKRMLPRGGKAARSVGMGSGSIRADGRANRCPGADLLMNADGTYESGYGWWYGGEIAPCYGAFAEGYNATGTVCGQRYALTTTAGFYTGQKLDAYLWNSDGCNPTSVIGVDLGISISAPGIWPTVTLHDIDTSNEPVSGDFFVGYWGEWPNASGGWLVGADLDGPGGKPRTNVVPGIGYPAGWTDPSIIWVPTRALGIGAYVLGKAVPVSIQTWGRIKSLYQ